MKLLVISSYPSKGTTHDHKTVGVASYTKNLIHELKKAYPSLSITVFAEILDKKSNYKEDTIQVKRMWKRGSFFSLLRMFDRALSEKADVILLSFEGYMFGKPLHTLFALFYVALLRLMGKKTYTLLHQVVSDFADIYSSSDPDGHRRNREVLDVARTIASPFRYCKITLLNFQKTILYKIILFASTEVIVFEQQLKNALNKNNEHVRVIPHFVPRIIKKDKMRARRRLKLHKKDTYILYFGFISPYKGIDWLVENWPQMPRIHLVVAGGANPNHVKNRSYKKFVAKVQKIAAEKGIITPGFIDEKEIPYYFAAADAVILPYKTFMSSSGPLSFALAYEKPVILSQHLKAYAKTPDIQEALETAGLTIKDLSFRDNPLSLRKALLLQKAYARQAIQFARLVKKSRSQRTIAKALYNCLFEQHAFRHSGE